MCQPHQRKLDRELGSAHSTRIVVPCREILSLTSRPSRRIAPVKSEYRVDLPAPFSPIIACTSPTWSSKETSRKAGTPRKLLETPEAESTNRPLPVPVSMYRLL